MEFIGLPVDRNNPHPSGEPLRFKAKYARGEKPWRESDKINNLALKLKKSGLHFWRVKVSNLIKSPDAEDWYDVTVEIPRFVETGTYHLSWCEEGLIFCDDKVESPNFYIINSSESTEKPPTSPDVVALPPKPIAVN
jgi:hypothetical protein